MIEHHIVTIVSDDRPGLVDRLAKAVAAGGGNWEESRLANLGGKFAGIINVSAERSQRDELQRELERLKDEGILVTLTSHTELPDLSGQKLVLSVVGNDRPGIVSAVCGVLSVTGINVEELQTECAPAPMSGEPLFYATAWLTAPDDVNIEVLRETLEQIADDLMIEIDPDED